MQPADVLVGRSLTSGMPALIAKHSLLPETIVRTCTLHLIVNSGAFHPLTHVQGKKGDSPMIAASLPKNDG